MTHDMGGASSRGMLAAQTPGRLAERSAAGPGERADAFRVPRAVEGRLAAPQRLPMAPAHHADPPRRECRSLRVRGRLRALLPFSGRGCLPGSPHSLGHGRPNDDPPALTEPQGVRQCLPGLQLGWIQDHDSETARRHAYGAARRNIDGPHRIRTPCSGPADRTAEHADAQLRRVRVKQCVFRRAGVADLEVGGGGVGPAGASTMRALTTVILGGATPAAPVAV